MDIVGLWLGVCRLHEAAKQWATDWTQAGKFQGSQVGRPLHSRSTGEGMMVRARAVLLTYQGEFGVWPDALANLPSLTPAEQAIAATNDLARDLVHGNTDVIRYLADVAEAVRATVQFQTLRLRCGTFVDDLQQLLHLYAHAWSLELCNKTLLERGKVRVHLHVFLSSGSNLMVRTDGVLMFMDTIGDASCYPFMRQRSSTAAAGLFYASADGKYGCIASQCSKEAHRDYVVQPQWVLNMMGMGKMSVTAARRHLVRQARDLPRLLASIDAYANERRKMSLMEHMQRTVSQLQALSRPFIDVPSVNDWVASHQALRWRYQFLVFVGGSMLGKLALR